MTFRMCFLAFISGFDTTLLFLKTPFSLGFWATDVFIFSYHSDCAPGSILQLSCICVLSLLLVLIYPTNFIICFSCVRPYARHQGSGTSERSPSGLKCERPIMLWPLLADRPVPSLRPPLLHTTATIPRTLSSLLPLGFGRGSSLSLKCPLHLFLCSALSHPSGCGSCVISSEKSFVTHQVGQEPASVLMFITEPVHRITELVSFFCPFCNGRSQVLGSFVCPAANTVLDM